MKDPEWTAKRIADERLRSLRDGAKPAWPPGLEGSPVYRKTIDHLVARGDLKPDGSMTRNGAKRAARLPPAAAARPAAKRTARPAAKRTAKK